MPGDEPVFQSTGRRRWRNWHDFEHRIEDLINVWNGEPGRSSVEGYNATTRGFQALLGDALRDGRRVRAIGGGWSYSKVGTAQGWLLNTRPLNYRFSLAGRTHPDFAGSEQHVAFVQGGNSIADLNRYFERKRQSLRTSGASNGQTIAGALQTGTHGAAIDVGAVPETVLALHLVTSPERSVWLERRSQPVAQDEVAAAFGAELIRDDALFDAALVGLGSCGVVHGAVVESTDLFFLQAWRRQMPLDENLWRAIDGLELDAIELPRAERPHHFQLFINPYTFEQDGPFVVSMFKDAEKRDDCVAPSFGQSRAGDGALEVMGLITDIAPDLTPALANFLIGQIYKPYERICGTHGEIFTDTAVRGKSASTAFGLPLGQVRKALTLVLERIRDDQVPVTVALRYVKASRATLAFTRHAPRTCVLEIDGPRSRRVLGTYQKVWRQLEEAGIDYTFHWGKMSDVDRNPERISRMYGDAADAWRRAREQLLPTAKLRHLFANNFLEGAGLA